MENTAQQNEPPDKGNFAQIVKQHSTPVKRNHADLPAVVKSRWFKCRIRNVKFLSWIIDQFKYVKVCAYSLSKYLKKNYVVLNVGFDVSCDEGRAEYVNAAAITLPSGTVIKAVPDELLDGNTYVPRPPQKIYLECVPYDLFFERDQLASALKEYVDYFEADHWEWVCEKGCFTGKVSVEVKLIKKKPPRDLEVLFNDQLYKIFTLTRGFDVKIKEEVDALAEIICHSCKQKGHLAKNCQARKNRIFSWKCTTCNGHSFNTGCREGSCQMASMISDVLVAGKNTSLMNAVQNENLKLDNSSPQLQEYLKHKYTIDKVERRAKTLRSLKLPKSKDDDIYKTNLIKLAERRAIKFALKSCASQGLERFADLCNKKLLEYTKALDHTSNGWYAGLSRVKCGEGTTIGEG